MTQGHRSETSDRILDALRKHPFALGPILGRMMLATNLSPVTTATVLGIYEQTLYRWIYALSEISPRHLSNVAKLLAVLSWILAKHVPLHGTLEARNEQFKIYVKKFKDAQKI